MKRSRFTEKQVIASLREKEAGTATAEVSASTVSAAPPSTSRNCISAGSSSISHYSNMHRLPAFSGDEAEGLVQLIEPERMAVIAIK